ncbi:MAG: sugar ABC transporter permease [Chloroflexota bacterium]|nr:sugar ABC transporter permease [Chloroflexota bacterium]
MSLARKDELIGYLFVAPQMIGFLLFVLGPIVAVFLFSTQERNLLSGVVNPVAFANFDTMLQSDRLFPKVLGNSLAFTLGLVPLNLLLSLTLAVLLTRKLRGTLFFRTLFFAPVITSTVAWAIVWRFLLQGEQGINQLLDGVGIDGPNWLREPGWAMASVIVTRVLKTAGLNMIIFMSAIQNIPREYDEAASVDGANARQVFFRITLPQLAPTILVALVLTIIGSLQVFDHILLMTNGGPANSTAVLIYYIWFQAFRVFDIGYASALAVVLFLIVLTATAVQWLLRQRFIYNER